MTSTVCYTARPSDFVVVATAQRSFTFFEARGIKFVIVVYSESVRVDGRLALSQLLGSRRATMVKKAKKAKKAKKTTKKKKK